MSDIHVYRINAPLNYQHFITDTCEVEIHLHDIYEIFQALSPNIRYFVEGNAYRLDAGDIIITNSLEIHRPVTIDDGHYNRRFIQFEPSLIPAYQDLDYNPLNFFNKRKPGTGNHLSIPDHAASLINQYFNTIEVALLNGGGRSLYEGRQILTQLLMALDTHYQKVVPLDSKALPMDQRIKDVLTDLDAHFCEPFNLDDFSRTHMMDKYYLSHLFKENTGFTLMEYIQSKRIQLSKQLLMSKETINEVAHACGYEDYSNFFKTFKKIVGMSPKNYRNQFAD